MSHTHVERQIHRNSEEPLGHFLRQLQKEFGRIAVRPPETLHATLATEPQRSNPPVTIEQLAELTRNRPDSAEKNLLARVRSIGYMGLHANGSSLALLLHDEDHTLSNEAMHYRSKLDPSSSRPYRPHVTLGRVHDLRDTDQEAFIQAVRTWSQKNIPETIMLKPALVRMEYDEDVQKRTAITKIAS